MVTVPGPEVVRLVPAKVDPRLLVCMDVDSPRDPSEVSDEMQAAVIVGIVGVEAERYKLAWKDCKAKLAAIGKIQTVAP